MKINKLTVLFLMCALLAMFACSVSLPNLYTAWAEAEELSQIKVDIDSLGNMILELRLDFEDHTHEIDGTDLKEQFDQQVKEWDVLIKDTLKLIKGRVR